MLKDRRRLFDLLGAPELSWIVQRLRRRLERGGKVGGALILADASPEVREAADRLLGRLPSSGRQLRVAPERLEQLLQQAEIADTLVDAIEALTGPLQSDEEHKARLASGWSRIEQQVLLRAAELPFVRVWWSQLNSDGYLRRLCGGDAANAQALVEPVLALMAELPAQGVPLPELAAMITGDSHAFDAGPLGTLAVRAAAAMTGQLEWSNATARREIWARAGVLCDELSYPALVLNLTAQGDNLSARLLGMHAAAGEPARLSTRTLLRHPPDFSKLTGSTAFVCENPAIVATAAARLGPRCAPLICTEGFARTAVRVLLSRLSASGVTLRVRADFDRAGLHMVRDHLRHPGAVPWRMDPAAYVAAAAGPNLRGDPGDTPWDPALSDAMRARGQAVHEEQLIELLLTDLAAPG